MVVKTQIGKWNEPFFRGNSSVQVVSQILVSRFSEFKQWFLVLLRKATFHFLLPFLRKRGDWKFSRRNYELGKLSNLVSSTQKAFKGTFAIISLSFTILCCRVVIFRYSMIGWLGIQFLTTFKPSMSKSILSFLIAAIFLFRRGT